jgi:hypothetical protein
MLMVGSMASGQGVDATLPAVQVTMAEWTRLRELTAALTTEHGTRALFERSPSLVEAFSSEDVFFAFVAPWRSRITRLPASLQEAQDVEVEVKRDGRGSSTFRLTYYHQQPANAITILRAGWQGDSLFKLGFMKGFTHEQTNDAAGVHRTRGGPPTAHKASRAWQ